MIIFQFPPVFVHITHINTAFVCKKANSGVCLFSFGSEESRAVCPAAQGGHFHLNRGPSMPSGVTLATVKTIVPAVSMYEKEVERDSSMPYEETLTQKVNKYPRRVEYVIPKE